MHQPPPGTAPAAAPWTEPGLSTFGQPPPQPVGRHITFIVASLARITHHSQSLTRIHTHITPRAVHVAPDAAFACATSERTMITMPPHEPSHSFTLATPAITSRSPPSTAHTVTLAASSERLAPSFDQGATSLPSPSACRTHLVDAAVEPMRERARLCAECPSWRTDARSAPALWSICTTNE